MTCRILSVCAVAACCSIAGWCQTAVPTAPTLSTASNASAVPDEGKHMFGIIPNFRGSATLEGYEPLTPREKFKIATQDSFDRGTVALGALFAGQSMLTNSNKDFAHGAAGFARYAGASYGDLVIGNYMTEAVFPSILHQDPRYFRRGTGSKWSRLAYASRQLFWTHRDSDGAGQFNYSEILGNSSAVAISNAYYVDNRTARSAIGKLSVQIGIDMTANILREFWPDLAHKLHRHRRSQGTASN